MKYQVNTTVTGHVSVSCMYNQTADVKFFCHAMTTPLPGSVFK
jgi:hypothetical protein